MDREFYLKLAQQRLAMPIGADLVLSEKEDPEAIRRDGPRLGAVITEAARRFKSPLAFPLMDLQIEKDFLLALLDIPEAERERYHIDVEEDHAALLERVRGCLADQPPTGRMLGALGAIQTVAAEPNLVPIGMSIGPFSFLTKLIDDPITQVYMAEVGDEDDEEVIGIHEILQLATDVVAHWIGLQIEAGAKAICVCEPAANIIYLSPKQLEADPEIFDRMVIQYNQQLVDLMQASGVDLIFHDCGELVPVMIGKFKILNPAILSLGSPVPLWEAVPHTRPDTVLFGNLPSKKFYSDKEYPEAKLEADAVLLRQKMDATGHPYILGSECDVLTVRGCECAIHRKTELLLRC